MSSVPSLRSLAKQGKGLPRNELPVEVEFADGGSRPEIFSEVHQERQQPPVGILMLQLHGAVALEEAAAEWPQQCRRLMRGAAPLRELLRHLRALRLGGASSLAEGLQVLRQGPQRRRRVAGGQPELRLAHGSEPGSQDSQVLAVGAFPQQEAEDGVAGAKERGGRALPQVPVRQRQRLGVEEQLRRQHQKLAPHRRLY